MKNALFAASTLLLALVPLTATSARAAEPYTVFVLDVDVGKDTGATSGAVTPSLCTALEKRPGLTVLCAPDVRQMLEAAGQLAAFGQQSPAAAKLQERLDGAHFVVKSYLRKTDKGMKLLLRLYHSGESAGGMVIPGKPAGRVVELAESGKLTDLLDGLPGAAARTEKMLYEPRNKPGTVQDEPPTPLEQ